MKEKLYNGIELPETWPPTDINPAAYEPMSVPCLAAPPDVIPVDVGRQLFVDNFLIEETDLEQIFHLAEKCAENPIMKPTTALERGMPGIFPAAVPKDGGVWWDPAEKIFKMWYEAGWVGVLAYAVSEDGLNWHRPELDVHPPTNQIIPELVGDSGAVVLDLETDDPNQRYKMFHREANEIAGGGKACGNSMVSPDGIHWSDPVKTGGVGDRSTMFYNPFRKKWVYSIRGNERDVGRARRYREHGDFLQGANWTEAEAVFWCGADHLDTPDPEIGDRAQLYNLNAVAYESLMVGLFEIHLGPNNKVCRAEGHPKITELKTAFSRDGFHWHRPDRRAFIPAARRPDAWDRGYVQSVGGICTIRDDELWFYYTGFQGDTKNSTHRLGGGFTSGLYANGSTGIAKLRRDGFASMRAAGVEGRLLTRPIRFSGSYLFVNVNAPTGELRVEIRDEQNKVLPGFSKEDCCPLAVDATRIRVRWQGREGVKELAGRPVRFCFHLRNGDLYAFWVSRSENGESNGYVAGGGPEFSGNRDLPNPS
jgi:hypothetical protein